MSVRFAAALLALTIASKFVAAQVPEGFHSNLENARLQAKSSGQPILVVFADPNDPVVRQVIKEALADKEIVAATKNFIKVMVPVADTELQKRLKLKGISVGAVMVLDWRGEQIGDPSDYTGASGYQSAFKENGDRFLNALTDDLSKAKPEAIPGLLAKLGGVRDKKAMDALLEFAKKDTATVAQRTAALKGLGNQVGGAEEIIPLLVDKNTYIRSAAAQALRTQGDKASDALLAGLASDDANLRAACHPLAVSATKFGKGRTATFWKTGPDADRAKLLEEWTAWWSSKKLATK